MSTDISLVLELECRGSESWEGSGLYDALSAAEVDSIIQAVVVLSALGQSGQFRFSAKLEIQQPCDFCCQEILCVVLKDCCSSALLGYPSLIKHQQWRLTLWTSPLSVCNADYPCEGMSRHATFENFGMAFLTLFQVSTGDNWNGIMKVLPVYCHTLSSFSPSLQEQSHPQIQKWGLKECFTAFKDAHTFFRTISISCKVIPPPYARTHRPRWYLGRSIES